MTLEIETLRRRVAAKRQLSSAAMRLFVKTTDVLGLTVDQRCAILGDISATTYRKWREKPACVVLARDQLERVSLVLGILKALRLIFADDANAFAWLRAANTDPPFARQSPLELMIAGGIIGLFRTRQYLDAWRNGG